MLVYSAGFFVTVSPGSVEIASSHCSEQGKTYCMNLSAAGPSVQGGPDEDDARS